MKRYSTLDIVVRIAIPLILAGVLITAYKYFVAADFGMH